METIHIIALHLAFGGVEKAIVNMANLFAEKYNVEIISVYDMPGAPAYKLDGRVKVRYLLKDTPNRAQWKAALRQLRPISFVRESFKAVKVLLGKKHQVKKAIKAIDSGIVITTRHEDNLVLSKYGNKNVVKIAQLHHDHRFERKYINAFKHSYSNIDYFTLLTPGLTQEVSAMMEGTKTKAVCIPNFLDDYPDSIDFENKEKTVVAAGRLNYIKRFDKLIDIFSRVHERAPDWTLKIIGDGDERENLQKQVSLLKAEDYIKFLGAKDAPGVQEEMLKASLYAMTSSSEGFAFVVVEAQSCGLPSVAFDVRVGPPYLINDGLDGYLVKDNDDEAFCDKLLELMNDREKCTRMGKAAVVRSRDFSKEKISKLWFDLLDRA